MEDLVKIEIVEKLDSPSKRAIVVIIIPGMKKIPSEIKI